MVFFSRSMCVLSLPLLLACSACGGAPDRPGPLDGDGESAPVSQGISTETAGTEDVSACPEGVVARCVIPLPTQGSAHNCTYGFSVCRDGKWSRCGGRETIDDDVEGGATE